MIDTWTLGHAAWGLFFAWRRVKFWPVVAVAFAWEWFENTVLLASGWGEPGDPLNSLMDVAVAAAACFLGIAIRAGLREDETIGEAMREWEK